MTPQEDTCTEHPTWLPDFGVDVPDLIRELLVAALAIQQPLLFQFGGMGRAEM